MKLVRMLTWGLLCCPGRQAGQTQQVSSTSVLHNLIHHLSHGGHKAVAALRFCSSLFNLCRGSQNERDLFFAAIPQQVVVLGLLQLQGLNLRMSGNEFLPFLRVDHVPWSSDHSY